MRVKRSTTVTIAADNWRLDPAAAFFLTIVLAIAFGAMRAAGTLGPAGLRFLLPLGFVFMALVPSLLLTAEGRREIGFKKPASPSIYLLAAGLGAVSAVACYLLGVGLFGLSSENWFVSIVNNFSQNVPTTFSVFQLYLMFTLTSISFSPIGEEIFFRGLLQRALEDRFSTSASTWIESLAFGLVHLCHHGLVAGAAGLVLLPRSAAIWFALMVALAHLLAWVRKQSGSLYPAIAAHAVFNFTMGTCIFAFLWPLQT